MENSKKPAYPCVRTTEDGDIDAIDGGLTKREHFAALAMQSYVNNYYGQRESTQDEVAKLSVKMADKLLLELSRAENRE